MMMVRGTPPRFTGSIVAGEAVTRTADFVLSGGGFNRQRDSVVSARRCGACQAFLYVDSASAEFEIMVAHTALTITAATLGTRYTASAGDSPDATNYFTYEIVNKTKAATLARWVSQPAQDGQIVLDSFQDMTIVSTLVESGDVVSLKITETGAENLFFIAAALYWEEA